MAIIGDGDVGLDVAGQAIFADSGATLMVAGISVIGSTTGVSNMGGALWLDQMIVIENVGSGSLVSTNGTSVVRNSMLGGNSNTGPAILLNGGTVTVVYSTLATGVDAPAISCSQAGAGSTVRNSFVVSRADAPEIAGCASLVVSDSAVETVLGDNLALGPVNTAWFANFNVGDFHLSNMAPVGLEGAAVWTSVDPSVDIDGQPRPSVDPSPDYAGADRP